MNLNQFLIKIFTYFPPNSGENAEELIPCYAEALISNKRHDYDYDTAAKDFIMSYKFRKLPTVAVLNDHLQKYVIKRPIEVVEYKDVYAWWWGNRYTFAYNPNEESYLEVKRKLQAEGLIVHDSENGVFENV